MKNKVITVTVATMMMLLGLSLPVAAGGVTDSKLFSGILALINDLTGWLVGAAVLIGGLFLVFNLIAMGTAGEEMDKIKYKKRAIIAVACTIGALVGVGLLNAIAPYFR